MPVVLRSQDSSEENGRKKPYKKVPRKTSFWKEPPDPPFPKHFLFERKKTLHPTLITSSASSTQTQESFSKHLLLNHTTLLFSSSKCAFYRLKNLSPTPTPEAFWVGSSSCFSLVPFLSVSSYLLTDPTPIQQFLVL